MKNKKSKIITLLAVAAASLLMLFTLTACGAAPYQARYDAIRNAFNTDTAWTVADEGLTVGTGDNIVTATHAFRATNVTNTNDSVRVFLFANSNYANTARDYLRENSTDIPQRSGNMVIVGTEAAVYFVNAVLAATIDAE